jgi:6-hydroxycyclohex-1-ene-1-carbonyl-CoA dehydrogenase
MQRWELRGVREPLVQTEHAVEDPGPGQVLVKVAGCGVCHTDLGYAYEGVRPRHALPLTLGHEIAGVVVSAGAGAEALVGRSVVVPAVIPCGECELCARGRGMICRRQIFPGCDVHGGFASHVTVPAHGLCLVDEARLRSSGVELGDLGVLGDAVSTAYQSILRTELREGDLAIVVGAGGVGSFCAQIAHSMGAHVIALDIDEARLARLRAHGADWTLSVKGLDPKAARGEVRGYAKERGLPETCWKIYECSGSAPGQSLAFGLLTFGAALGVVGYTLDTIEVRLSNLMAFDAVAVGSWGCLPEHFPHVLDLVLDRKIAVAPFIERVPMSRVNETLAALHEGRLDRRPILVPDFE